MLMFDYAAPKTFPPRPDERPLGVGQHPHRGFETVTIAFQGEVEHHDSTGKSGVIHPGDVQWMTAGRGIVHQEYHSQDFTETGGTFEMCQLWVNLPKKHKMVKPRYQAIKSKQIPTVTLTDDSTDESAAKPEARLIAGELLDVKGPAKTYSPVNLWDVSLPNKKTTVEIPYPADHACIVFVRRGTVIVDGKKLNPQDVAIMKTDGESPTLKIDVLQSDSSVLIMGGEPIDEPIASMGPMVMNTQEELRQAFSDYRAGKFER